MNENRPALAIESAGDYVRVVGDRILLNSEQEAARRDGTLEALWTKLGLDW